MANQTAKTYTFTIPANQAYPLNVAGKYFKIITATGLVRVDSFDGISLDGMSGGNGQEDTPFSRLHFTDQSGAPNTIKVVVSDEKFIDSSLGNVAVTGAVTVTSAAAPRAAFVHSAPAMNVASAALAAANPNRQYLLIQNQHGSLDLWVNAAGGVAVAGAGSVKIAPGGSWEPEVAPTGAINGIGLGANALVTVVEG